MNSETREHECKWSRWNRSCANIWSKFDLQLPWITSSPSLKGDHQIWPNTGCVRYCTVMYRIIKWRGLKAYNVGSSLNIWTKFGVWFPWTLFGRPPIGENCVISIFYSIEWRGRWMGGMLGWIVTVNREYSTYINRIMNCTLWIVNCKTVYSSLFGLNSEL